MTGFNDLWSKAVGQPGYDKAEWLALERRIEAMESANAEMLAACLAAAEALRHDCCCGGCGCLWTKEEARPALMKILAALAKAEGRDAQAT